MSPDPPRVDIFGKVGQRFEKDLANSDKKSEVTGGSGDPGRRQEMAKGRAGGNHQRAMQQKIEAGYNIVTSSSVIGQPSKADLRAAIPAYDESMVRKIEAKPAKKSRK